MSTTTLSPREAAQAAQRQASDPEASAWVGASAGSGKTKVLTDRVLRLLLRPDTRPGRILCLTFTKAAAAEMAQRLARRLGEWVVAEASVLERSLRELTGETPDDALRARARALFAEVLEQPGGMRIATIHSFCQSLLRGFPLEAGLPPQFTLIEETEAATMLAEAREATLASGRLPQAAIEAMAGLGSPEDFADTLRTLVRERERLGQAIAAAGGLRGSDAVLRRRLGLPPEGDEAAAVAQAARLAAREELVRAAALLRGSGNANDRARGDLLKGWMELPEGARAARWEEWTAIFLTAEGTPRKSLATKGGLKERHEEAQSILGAEAERVFALEESRKAWRLHAASLALLGLAQPVLEAYVARKSRIGAVDFDDLIQAARRLLNDPGSAWVLYKLDGGLDHLLLDEAQDSNPDQWGIAAKLAEEFFAGQGTREGEALTPRSIFAVGDEKQSIYSFQGADAAGFARWEEHFARAVRAAGSRFAAVPLNVSFRSTAPVLALVDAVFAEGAARRGVVAEGDTLRHRADRAGDAGMVELWPPLVKPGNATLEPWQVPDEPVAEADAEALMAESLAARIAHMVRHETLPAQGGRRIRPGDILVLLRRRTGFSNLLVRALKARGVTVGGVDRLRLIEQIAVQDLLALIDVLLLPEDDLQLAALLKSPLCGLSETELCDLARAREQPLWWRVLAHRGEDTATGRAADWLADLADRADLATPHSILAEVLGEHGGRARILARLGPDAADPLDEVLNAALTYESRHPPSLQGFVHWLRRGAAEVKREAESGADAVRLMTAHGSKGLQAPIVILPDVGSGRGEKPVRWEEAEPPLPYWAPRNRRDFFAPAWTALMEADNAAREAEENRLLYVALTRAEDRLLVCAWGEPKPGSWYDLVAQGFARLDGAEEIPFEPAAFGAPPLASFAGPLRRLASAQKAPPRATAEPEHPGEDTPLPEWIHRPAAPESEALTLSPSALPGEEETPTAAPHGRADPTGERFRRGRLIHALLQHLPDYPEAGRAAVAARFLDRPGHGLDEKDRAETLREVMRLLEEPALRAVFGPGSLAEAPLAGRVNGLPLAGQVDRMLITPERVLVLDYKTNRPPPERVEDVPALYLRQMASYRALLRQAFPGREVECWLLWTWVARVMKLPGVMLDRYEPA